MGLHCLASFDLPACLCSRGMVLDKFSLCSAKLRTEALRSLFLKCQYLPRPPVYHGMYTIRRTDQGFRDPGTG